VAGSQLKNFNNGWKAKAPSQKNKQPNIKKQNDMNNTEIINQLHAWANPTFLGFPPQIWIMIGCAAAMFLIAWCADPKSAANIFRRLGEGGERPFGYAVVMVITCIALGIPLGGMLSTAIPDNKSYAKTISEIISSPNWEINSVRMIGGRISAAMISTGQGQLVEVTMLGKTQTPWITPQYTVVQGRALEILSQNNDYQAMAISATENYIAKN
jgi:hypothetical protein